MSTKLTVEPKLTLLCGRVEGSIITAFDITAFNLAYLQYIQIEVVNAVEQQIEFININAKTRY